MEMKNFFFELLCKNSKEELEAFIIKEGKGPKPICPIVFDVLEDQPANLNKKEEDHKNA